MEKTVIGDLTFTIHNKREKLWINNVKWKIETITKYLQDKTELTNEGYSEQEADKIIEFRLHDLNGDLSACFWCDVLAGSALIYSTDDFKAHFM